MKITKIAFITVVLFLAGANVFAQEAGSAAANDREVGEQFRALHSKSYEIRWKNAYRETTEIVTEGPSGERKRTRIAEVVPPDRRRYLFRTEIDGKTESHESITIGDQIYARENGGPWKSQKVDSRFGTGSMASNIKLIGKTNINGRPVTVFEDMWSSSSDFGDSSGVTRYWFTDDGYLLKTLEKRKAKGTEPATVETSSFEYDPKIKIEAPIKP